MPVFRSGGEIYQTEGSDFVWATTRRPALLFPSAAVTLTNFDISYPDLAKSNGYGFTWYRDPIFGTDTTACASYVTINPQEWDSGLTHVCDLPAQANYFELELSLSRIVAPSPWLGTAIPALLGTGQHMPDGNAALIEGIGPFVRMFAFERSGNAVHLRRKQSVANDGPTIPWNSGNNNDNGSGGMRPGFTYGGSPNAWPSHVIEQRTGGNIYKRRGEVNQCSLADPTNYSSLWRGTVTVTPGYIAP